MVALLLGAGYNASSAVSGSEMDDAQQHRFHLIIIDAMLPEKIETIDIARYAPDDVYQACRPLSELGVADIFRGTAPCQCQSPSETVRHWMADRR